MSFRGGALFTLGQKARYVADLWAAITGFKRANPFRYIRDCPINAHITRLGWLRHYARHVHYVAMRKKWERDRVAYLRMLDQRKNQLQG